MTVEHWQAIDGTMNKGDAEWWKAQRLNACA